MHASDKRLVRSSDVKEVRVTWMVAEAMPQTSFPDSVDALTLSQRDGVSDAETASYALSWDEHQHPRSSLQ